ncbi:hypothetical protein ES702_07701 [subsurface metagenome]
MSPGRLPEEDVLLIAGDTLQVSQTKTYRDIFPLSGEGWRKIRLSFHHVVGAGGTVPNPLGAYRFIKGINLRTSRNENPISVPGMGLYYLNYLMNGVEPGYTTVVAGALTFHCNIDIPFTFPFISKKEDLSILSSRYTMIELELQTGTLADLQRTPAAATQAVTVDISLVRNKSGFKDTGQPIGMPYIKHLAPFQAVAKGYADIESADDLILFGFFAVANDLVTWGTVGNPFDGTPVDLMTDISFEDNLMSWVKTKKVDSFQEDRAHYSNSRTLAGVYPYLFAKEGSYKSGYPTGGRSEIKFKIGNGAYVAATTPQVDIVLFGTRELR